MKCPYCASEHVPDGARFCPFCAQELPAGPGPPRAGEGTRRLDRTIDFTELISRSTAGFVGRDWLRREVDRFLAGPGKAGFLVLGEPGCGKTAFLAQLVKERGYVHHFCGKGAQTGLAEALDWRDPVCFAESVSAQLVRAYGGWIIDWERWGIHVSQKVRDLQGLLVGALLREYEAVPGAAGEPAVAVEQDVEHLGEAATAIGVYVHEFKVDVERVVGHLVIEPLRAIARRWPRHKIVILVDALDEAAIYSGERNIMRVLPVGELPENVRFLLASGDGPHLTNDFLGQVQLQWLSQDRTGKLPAGAELDAQEFVRRLSVEGGVPALLERHNLKPDEFVDKVAKASRGNFLYLRHFAEGLRQCEASLLDLAALPQGLYGIYADMLAKIEAGRGDVGWDKEYKPVLGTLAVAQAPLTRDQLATLSGVGRDTTGTILSQLQRVRDVTGQGAAIRYALYHPSFGSFLVSPENENGIDGPAAHQRIAAHYLRLAKSGWENIDSYGLEHLVHHVVEGGDTPQRLAADLDKVLTIEFMQVRAEKAGWHMPFVQDLQEVAAKAPALVVAPAVRILVGSHRNSLVNQEVVRLLHRIWPACKGTDGWESYFASDKDRQIREAMDALELPADEAVPELRNLLAKVEDRQVKGAVALALGETGSQKAVPILHQLLRTAGQEPSPGKDDWHEGHVGWCAADALIALHSRQNPEPWLIEALRSGVHDSALKPAVRGRMAYVLGRLQAQLPLDQALALVRAALVLRGDNKVRAIDLIWLLLPRNAAEQQQWINELELPYLWPSLGFAQPGAKVNKKLVLQDEWAQRRLVVALGRIGSAAALPHLRRFAAEVEARPLAEAKTEREKRSLERQRERLQDAIERAIGDLERRHGG